MNPQPVTVIIVAGGKGLRMNNAVPKQFLELEGKPILYHTMQSFIAALGDPKFILVLPKEHISYAQQVLVHFEERLEVTIVKGGVRRFDSVRNGIAVAANNGIIMIQDGVRPFASATLIKNALKQTQQHGSAIPAIPVTDSIRVVNKNNSAIVDRDTLRAIQTPQCFQAALLKAAYADAPPADYSDDAAVFETAGNNIHLIPGEKTNIKITTPEDMLLANFYVQTMHQ